MGKQKSQLKSKPKLGAKGKDKTVVKKSKRPPLNNPKAVPGKDKPKTIRVGKETLELIAWLTNKDKLHRGHQMMDKDVYVESKGLLRPNIFDLQNHNLNGEGLLLMKPFDYSTDKTRPPVGVSPQKYSLTLSNPIPVQIFRRGDFKSEDYAKYDINHFRPLKSILNVVDKRFDEFALLLNYRAKNNYSRGSMDDTLRRTESNLRKVIKDLRKKEDGYEGISIPDLFSTTLSYDFMTNDLADASKRNRAKEKPVRLYTCMYSRETSQAFSAVLAEKLEEKLKDLETELSPRSNQRSDLKNDSDIKQWLASMPHLETKDKMRVTLDILGIKELDENKVSWGVGELIFIYRALEEAKAIIPGLDNYKIGVALSILTGKSHLTFLNSYVHPADKNYDLGKIFKGSKSELLNKENICYLAHKVQLSVDNLIKEMGGPFISPKS